MLSHRSVIVDRNILKEDTHHRSMIWFRQIAQLSTTMSQAHKATAFHFLTSKRGTSFPSDEGFALEIVFCSTGISTSILSVILGFCRKVLLILLRRVEDNAKTLAADLGYVWQGQTIVQSQHHGTWPVKWRGHLPRVSHSPSLRVNCGSHLSRA